MAMFKATTFRDAIIPHKPLPEEITSYDLLKTFAVLTMIVDHIGYYFYPDTEWLRIVGRLSAPVWFFLIGYANSRDLGPRLWWGMLILVVANVITGQAVLPLNILGTMIFLRLVIDTVMDRSLRDYEILFALTAVSFFLILPSSFLWEYGTASLFFAMYGWFVRHPDRVRYPRKYVVQAFIAISGTAYLAYQSLLFGLDRTQIAILAALGAAGCFFLYRFRPATYPALTATLPGPLTRMIRFMGRRTLEIYVLHLVLFKFAALTITHDERFEWFKLALFPFQQ